MGDFISAVYQEEWDNLKRKLDDTSVDKRDYAESLSSMIDELRSRLEAAREDIRRDEEG